jgi:hypothetical protein
MKRRGDEVTRRRSELGVKGRRKPGAKERKRGRRREGGSE